MQPQVCLPDSLNCVQCCLSALSILPQHHPQQHTSTVNTTASALWSLAVGHAHTPFEEADREHLELAAAMEERLGYTQRMLARHQKTTIIPEAGIGNQNRSNNAYFNRQPAGPESDDVAARNGSNRHNNNGAVALPVGSLRGNHPLVANGPAFTRCQQEVTGGQPADMQWAGRCHSPLCMRVPPTACEWTEQHHVCTDMFALMVMSVLPAYPKTYYQQSV